MNRASALWIPICCLALACDRPTATAEKPAPKPIERPLQLPVMSRDERPMMSRRVVKPTTAATTQAIAITRMVKSDQEWKKLLTPQQYEVLRNKDTERAGTGEYLNNHAAGVYTCAACGLDLFSSDAKFESGTGWPSYWKPIAPGHVREITDADGSRTEVTCARCDGHLGHVFDDGPKPTGLRYCMNSVSLKFVPADAKK